MSYILEALKKADAERERGAVPGLHTQAEPLPADEHPAPAGTPAKVWVLAGLSVGAALATGFALWGGGVSQAVDPMPPSATAPVPVPPLAPTPTPARVAPAEPRSASPAPLTTEANKPTQAMRTAAAPVPTTAPPTSTPLAPRESSKPMAAPRSAASQSGTPDPQRPLTISELPENIRRELPTLSIGGAMHSDTPSSRMLILSNGVFHEGEQPVPGLMLEEIRLKSAVFRYKGYRYSVNY